MLAFSPPQTSLNGQWALADSEDLAHTAAASIMTSTVPMIETFRSPRDAQDFEGRSWKPPFGHERRRNIIGITPIKDLLEHFRSYAKPKIAQDLKATLPNA